MNTLTRKIAKVSLWVVIVAVALFGLQLTVLAYPQPFFDTNVEHGTIKLYGNLPEPELTRIARHVETRLQASPLYDPTRQDRVFLFDSDGAFRFYARLTFLHPSIQGYNLSILGNSYVNAARVEELGRDNTHLPRHSIHDGDVAHIIAHELAHQHFADKYGRSIFKSLPMWKREGYPEYVANIMPIRRDSAMTLHHRIDLMTNAPVWGQGYSHPWEHYAAELLWEYYLDVKGYTIDDILADSVTRTRGFEELLAWHDVQ